MGGGSLVSASHGELQSSTQSVVYRDLRPICANHARPERIGTFGRPSLVMGKLRRSPIADVVSRLEHHWRRVRIEADAGRIAAFRD